MHREKISISAPDPLEQYGASLLLAVLQRMGACNTAGQCYTPMALARDLGVVPEYTRLFHALFGILRRAGYVTELNGQFQTADAIHSAPSPEQRESMRQKLVDARPELAPHVESLQICLEAYPEILTGNRNHLQVLFPEGSLAQLEAIYKGDSAADACGRLSANLIASYVRAKSEIDADDPVRILETGAGTGATSTLILHQLRALGVPVEFVYSDLSPAFLEHGRRSFAEQYPFITFSRLDLEAHPSEQHFTGGEFDVVFAGNVLHATRNIRETLGNLKWLLRRNGLLLIDEITSSHSFATLVFGLTSGWWRYEDESERITDSPLLSAESWRRLLSEAGFTQVEMLRPAGDKANEMNHWCVFAGESDGRVGRPASKPGRQTIAGAAVVPSASERGSGSSLDTVRHAFADVLRIPPARLHPDATFEKFGVDSLVALELNKRLERDFGPLPATLLFEHNTAAKLAAHLATLQSSHTPEKETAAKRLAAALPHRKPSEASSTQAGREPIAIIGLAGRYPLADNVNEFWTNLRNGRNCVRPFPAERLADLPLAKAGPWFGGFLDRVDAFDPQFFGISPAEAEYIDPQERLWLETVWHVLEDAGYTRATLSRLQCVRKPIGLFAGSMYQQYSLVTTQPETASRLGASGHWSMANRASYLLHLEGPSLAVDTACSSSFTAIHLACESLWLGECSAAIAGGVNLTLHPGKLDALRTVGMMSSQTASRAFGDSDGLIPGEGAGAVFLKPLVQAVADGDFVYAVIRGSAINHGGKTGGYRVPNPVAQAQSLTAALQLANLSPESISYIEAAANGSPLGDPIEITGLQSVCPASGWSIGSLKSNLGHLEAASGISQLTKLVGQFRDGLIYPTIHTEPVNPRLGIERSGLRLVKELQPWNVESGPRRAAISSFGAGGSNAHLIVEEYASDALPPISGRPELTLISARTQGELRQCCERLLMHLERAGAILSLPYIAYTTRVGREAHTERLAFLVMTVDELCQELRRCIANEPGDRLQGSTETGGFVDFFSGESGVVFLQSLHDRLDYRRAASLWVKGADLDWSAWEPERHLRRVPLPGYPFARRRCWIETRNNMPQRPQLHALVHQNTSTLAQQSYRTHFSGEELFLAEHTVLGKRVLPAAALIEMARAAVELASGHTVGLLRNVSWTRPLIVDSARGADVEIRISTTGVNAIAFAIWSAGEELAAGVTEGEAPPFLPEAKPNTGGPLLLTSESLYEGCERAGLVLGPSFRTVRSLHGGDPDICGVLESNGDLGEFVLVPGLLDGVLQCLAAFRSAGSEQSLQMPFWIDAIEIHSPLYGSVTVQASRSVIRDDSFDLSAWTAGEKLAVRLRGVQTRPIGKIEPPSIATQVEAAGTEEPSSLEPLLCRLAGEILKLDIHEVPRMLNFLEYGFDSTTLVVFSRRIAEALNLEVSPAELFARPNIAQLAAKLSKQNPLPSTRIAVVPRATYAAGPRDNEPIAIIGMAGTFPGSPTLEAFWTNLAAGRDLISEVPADRWYWQSFPKNNSAEPDLARWGGFLEHVDQFDPLFFGISPREAAWMDPQQRLFLHTVWHAIENAGYRSDQLAKTRTGLYVGVATSDYADLIRRQVTDVESQMATGIAHSILANRISYLLDLRGPSQPIDTACSSSLVAIHHAVEAIRKGDCEMAIAGGVNVMLSPTLAVGFGKAGFMSPSGRCRAFSAAADGYVRGEGVGAILLKPLAHALDDGDYIHSIIRGTAVNHGGHSASLTAPNAEAQTELLLSAWKQAGVDAKDIGYLEAHGTGTALGDPIEVLGIKEAFEKAGVMERQTPCFLGSVKSNIGHLEAASGIAGIVKTVLALQNRQIPATLHVDEVNSYLPLRGTPIEIARQTQPWLTVPGNARIAGVSSFGFGGTNAHVLLEEAPQRTGTIQKQGPFVAVLSARSQPQLCEYAATLASFLEDRRTLSLADICFTLYHGRDEMDVRWAAQVSTVEELIHQLHVLKDDAGEQPPQTAPLKLVPVQGRRVPLPGYPFSQAHHWFNKPRFSSITLHPSENRIAHHVVGGHLVCAGAVLLSLAVDAVRPGADLHVAEWNWIEPLVLDSGARTLQIHTSDNSVRVEADGIVYARGELSRHLLKPRRTTIPEGSATTTAEALYDLFAAHGVAYGSWFRRIDALREIDRDEVWAHFTLPEDDTSTLRADLLDAAWQVAAFLTLHHGGGLPFGIRDLRWSPKLPVAGWIHATQQDGRLEIEACGEDGSVALHVGELILRRPAPADSNLIYIPGWEAVPVASNETTVNTNTRLVMIGASDDLAAAIETIYPDSRAVAIDASDPAAIVAQKLSRHNTIEHLVWILPMGAPSDIDGESILSAQSDGMLVGFRIFKALLSLGYGTSSFQLTVVATGAQALTESENEDPTHAGVPGLIGSLAKECPNWQVRFIDAERGAPLPLRGIFNLVPRFHTNAWLHRSGQWYRQQLFPCNLNAHVTATTRRDDGVYIIIGGAGGIGEAYTEHLLQTSRAQVIWIGRRPLDSSIESKLDHLATLGPRPVYMSADARNHAALEDVRDEIKARFGSIRGIVHSAIVMSDASFAKMSEENFLTGYSAKADVSVRIAQVFSGEPLDFLLFFSSIQSFAKAPGQSNYAAGCTFQDSFAAWLSRRVPYPVKVMNWGYWGSTGVVASGTYRKRMERLGIGSIEPAEGMAALDRLLAAPVRQVSCMKVPGIEESQGLGLDLNSEDGIVVASLSAPAMGGEVYSCVHAELSSGADGETLLCAEQQQKLSSLNALVRMILRNQLKSLNLIADGLHSVEGWQPPIEMPAMYKRWLKQTMALLAEHTSDRFQTDAETLWSQWEQYKTVWDLDPLFNGHALLEVTLKALPAILRGERKATEVLFSHSSTALVENVYKHNPVSGHYNRVIGEMVASYVVQRQHSRLSPIRILEIGAGTGSTTGAVLDRLRSHPEAVAEYCYTDISKAFLTHAQKEYGPSHPFLVYRLFDVEKPVANQQIETGAYDLVLASNVLHATRNVRSALRNAKALLKRNGLLLLNEITGATLFGHVTFGLLEGWWLYDDAPLRIDGCPGVAPQTWNWLLQAEGFHSVQFPAEESHSSGQQIVMAESDGVIRQQLRLPKPPVPARRKSPASISSLAGCTNPIDRLTAILSELLSIPPDEFDIKIPLDRYGLDSIVTLEFCRELRPEFGEISPGSIFEHRTIQALASFLGAVPQDAEIRRLPRELLLLDSGRPGIRDNRVPASVWVHGAPGYAQVFRALAKNSEYPIYAFQARGVDGDSVPFSDLGAMADYYFKCLESEVPDGPLVLGGYSLGGVIALEVARRWSAAGHTIAHLVLLDTYPKTPEVEHVFSSLRDEGFYQVLLANMFLAARGYEPVPLTEADLAGVPASLRLGELARLVSRRNENRVSEDDVYRALLGTTAVSNFTGEAFRKFHIEPYAASDVSFVRARRGFILPAEDKLPAVASEFRSFDYVEPWRRLIRTKLAVYTIDTDHFSLLGSEGAAEVRNLLAAIMQGIEIRRTGSVTLPQAPNDIYEEAASSAVTQ